ncbi:MAG: zinc protease [Candidatus Muproteobacteria bacterium RBG_16_64_11]|uniref:Zinc protease n=1 Tax=Candidatus Muproteobacteria bacterium RBG_16_64_11 TaxID=1817758 RepID=A0A1F6TBC2_9PROT|nr:MAG: zinc protease [Candidatus Muproteobacteria bacterium RBG_16_64_11]
MPINTHAARLAGLALLLLSAAAQAVPPLQQWTLANGARVYFVETRELPIVQLRVLFDAGAAREPPGKEGLARLTARMLREGAGRYDANQIAETLEGLGAELGNDASGEMAELSLRSLAERKLRAPAVEILRQMLLAPTLPEDGFQRERTRSLVALQKALQSPGEVAARAFYQGLYGAHPYARHPNGTEAGLKAIAHDDLVEFYRSYYVGANAVLALVGDLSADQARALAQRLLGDLPAGSAPPPLPPVPDRTRAERRTVKHPSSQTHILIGQPGMTRTDPDYFPLLVGNHILGGGGLVSRLSDEVREKRGLSYSVHSYFAPLRERGPFLMGLQTENARRDEAEAVMRRTLTEYVAEGPTERELAAAKKNLSGGFPLRIDSNRKLADYAATIGFYNLPLGYLDEFIPRVEAVTAEQVRDALRRRLRADTMFTVVVGGDK